MNIYNSKEKPLDFIFKSELYISKHNYKKHRYKLNNNMGYASIMAGTLKINHNHLTVY